MVISNIRLHLVALLLCTPALAAGGTSSDAGCNDQYGWTLDDHAWADQTHNDHAANGQDMVIDEHGNLWTAYYGLNATAGPGNATVHIAWIGADGCPGSAGSHDTGLLLPDWRSPQNDTAPDLRNDSNHASINVHIDVHGLLHVLWGHHKSPLMHLLAKPVYSGNTANGVEDVTDHSLTLRGDARGLATYINTTTYNQMFTANGADYMFGRAGCNRHGDWVMWKWVEGKPNDAEAGRFTLPKLILDGSLCKNDGTGNTNGTWTEGYANIASRPDSPMVAIPFMFGVKAEGDATGDTGPDGRLDNVTDPGVHPGLRLVNYSVEDLFTRDNQPNDAFETITYDSNAAAPTLALDHRIEPPGSCEVAVGGLHNSASSVIYSDGFETLDIIMLCAKERSADDRARYVAGSGHWRDAEPAKEWIHGRWAWTEGEWKLVHDRGTVIGHGSLRPSLQSIGSEVAVVYASGDIYVRQVLADGESRGKLNSTSVLTMNVTGIDAYEGRMAAHPVGTPGGALWVRLSPGLPRNASDPGRLTDQVVAAWFAQPFEGEAPQRGGTPCQERWESIESDPANNTTEEAVPMAGACFREAVVQPVENWCDRKLNNPGAVQGCIKSKAPSARSIVTKGLG